MIITTLSESVSTGYKKVREFTLPAETVCHIWLPPRLSAISCLLPRLLCLVNSSLQRLSVWFSFLPRLGRKLNHTDSLCRKPFFVDGSLGRKPEIMEAKYDEKSLQEAKLSGLVYTLWSVEPELGVYFYEIGCKKNFQGKELHHLFFCNPVCLPE